MRGYPITRATSPDGRWAYTLYDGAGAHPFIHALDTTGGEAACIDLDALTGRQDLAGLTLGLGGDGEELTVRDAQGPVLSSIGPRSASAHRSPSRGAQRRRPRTICHGR